MGKINILAITRNDEERNVILAAISNNDDLRVIGIENDEASTVIKSERLKPDVLIIDLQPSGMDGTELAPIILRRSPSTSIIMMCDRDENDYAGMALRAGISGYLLRKADMNKLSLAVRIVNLGGYYISASITLRALDTISLIKRLPGQFIDNNNNLPFSSKERRIITDITQGFTDGEIAEHLNYSPGTIKNCVTAIKRKTKLKNRIEIATYSLAYGLINLDQLNILKSNRHIFNNGIK